MLDPETGKETRPDRYGKNLEIDIDNLKYIYHCTSGYSETNLCIYKKPQYYLFEARGEDPRRYMEIVNNLQKDPEKKLVMLNPITYEYSMKKGYICIKLGFLRKLVSKTIGGREFTPNSVGTLRLRLPRWGWSIKVDLNSLTNILYKKDETYIMTIGAYQVTLQNIKFIYSVSQDCTKVGINSPFSKNIITLTTSKSKDDIALEINDLYLYEEDCLVPVIGRIKDEDPRVIWIKPKYLKQVIGKYKKNPDQDGYIKTDIPSRGEVKIKRDSI